MSGFHTQYIFTKGNQSVGHTTKFSYNGNVFFFYYLIKIKEELEKEIQNSTCSRFIFMVMKVLTLNVFLSQFSF